jgi:hypothetical protein
MEHLALHKKGENALMTSRVRVGMNRLVKSGRGESGKQQQQQN